MAWKKDLAKLKQTLDKEEDPPAKAAPPPKARPAAPASGSMEEEDKVFLAAMGVRAKRPAQAPLREEPITALTPPPPAGGGEFNAAMGDLKGMKPLHPDRAQPAPAPAPVPAAAAPPLPETAPAPPADPTPAAPPPAAAQAVAPEPASPAQAPAAPAVPPQVQIHLAAGMAVVVDGSLDLRGHARRDAEERLKERILDGYALGWRTLHVIVGSSPELRQMVLDLLASPAGGCLARYAQAPVPMGGTQAWILYFRASSQPEN